jgi:pilus assembly protein CpaC
MLFSQSQYMNKSVISSGFFKAGILAASLLTAASLAFGLSASLTTGAIASDLDPAVQEDGGRFVRLGLNKSAVIKLPGEARDVIVGNSGIVDVVIRSKDTAYLFARGSGQTNIFFFDANGGQILALDLEVSLDVTAIRKALRRALPGHQITVDTTNNNIILGGVARNALEAKTAVEIVEQFTKGGALGAGEGGGGVLNTMRVSGEDQVMLKVKVVEIQRDVLKQLGVDMQALIDAGSSAFNLANLNPIASSLIAPKSGYAGAFSAGGVTVDAVVRAMESDGVLRTLAEPNLTALTGTDAKFHAGGQFPFCKTANDRDECTTVEYKDYGVEVAFAPTVIDEGRISLKIDTSVSELGNIVNGTPVFNRRGARTVLELPSGGSMMIAGLIRETDRQTINGTPGLKKLPILGTLFRSRDFIKNETELVIIVTPYLVRATGEKQLVTPDKGFNLPTDRQTIFMGRLNKVYGVGGKSPDGSYNGNVGFIVE